MRKLNPFNPTFGDVPKIFLDRTKQLNTVMARMTAGFAYAFQLLGYLVWDTEDKLITDNTLQIILPEYKEMPFTREYYF